MRKYIRSFFASVKFAESERSNAFLFFEYAAKISHVVVTARRGYIVHLVVGVDQKMLGKRHAFFYEIL